MPASQPAIMGVGIFYILQQAGYSHRTRLLISNDFSRLSVSAQFLLTIRWRRQGTTCSGCETPDPPEINPGDELMFGYSSIPLRLACVAGVTAIAALTAAPATASPVTYDITFLSGTNGSGQLPTSASFTYDSATPVFSNFLVVWNSVTIELTDSANVGASQSANQASACGLAPGAAFSFLLLSEASCLSGVPFWQASSDFGFARFQITYGVSGVYGQTSIGSQVPNANANGYDWQIVARTAPPNLAPEPSSLALLGLAGVALGWSGRRRRAKHFTQ